MTSPGLKLVTSCKGVQLGVKVIPRAARPGPDGVLEGRLKLRLASPPTDGRANAEALEILAALLGLPKRNLEIVAGTTSRQKLVLILGLSADAVFRRLEIILRPDSTDARGARKGDS